MTIGANDYPYGRVGYDPYGFAAGQCASFADWRCINDFRIGPQHSPTGLNGGQWADYLASKGYAVDGAPRVHDIFSLPPGVDGAGAYGHVGVVLAVNGDATVLVEDYNWNDQETYSQHSLRIAGARFAHVAPAPGPAPPPPPAPQPPFWQVPFASQVDINFQGTIDVDNANLRSGPGTNYPLAGGPLHRGARINFYAYVYGQAVYDPVARDWDRRWFRIANGGGAFTPPYDGRLVASALVYGNPPGSHP